MSKGKPDRCTWRWKMQWGKEVQVLTPIWEEICNWEFSLSILLWKSFFVFSVSDVENSDWKSLGIKADYVMRKNVKLVISDMKISLLIYLAIIKHTLYLEENQITSNNKLNSLWTTLEGTFTIKPWNYLGSTKNKIKYFAVL